MKKLVLILVVFALIATPVFSQISIGGMIETYGILGTGDFNTQKEIDDIKTNGDWGLDIAVTAVNLPRTAGGKAVLVNGRHIWAYGWWKPSNILFLKTGNIFEDSTWAADDISGLGFHANKFDIVRPLEAYAGNVLRLGHGFYLPTIELGVDPSMQLTLSPIDGLDFNIAVPFQKRGVRNTITDTYVGNLHFQAVYYFDGIGEAAVSFINSPDSNDQEIAAKRIFAQWRMSFGANMRLELGVNYDLSGQTETSNNHPDRPINFGLGFGMGNLETGDPMVINIRLGASIPSIDTDNTLFGFDVLFSYDLGIFRLYLPVGLGLVLPSAGDPLVAWSFAPYLTKSFLGPYLFFGFNIYNGSRTGDLITNLNDVNLNWSIPIGLRWDF